MLKSIMSIWKAPSPESIALRELEEAKRSMLQAQTAKEYAESMVKYHDARIRRLTQFLKDAHTEDRKNEQVQSA